MEFAQAVIEGEESLEQYKGRVRLTLTFLPFTNYNIHSNISAYLCEFYPSIPMLW